MNKKMPRSGWEFSKISHHCKRGTTSYIVLPLVLAFPPKVYRELSLLVASVCKLSGLPRGVFLFTLPAQLVQLSATGSRHSPRSRSRPGLEHRDSYSALEAATRLASPRDFGSGCPRYSTYLPGHLRMPCGRVLLRWRQVA